MEEVKMPEPAKSERVLDNSDDEGGIDLLAKLRI